MQPSMKITQTERPCIKHSPTARKRLRCKAQGLCLWFAGMQLSRLLLRCYPVKKLQPSPCSHDHNAHATGCHMSNVVPFLFRECLVLRKLTMRDKMRQMAGTKTLELLWFITFFVSISSPPKSIPSLDTSTNLRSAKSARFWIATSSMGSVKYRTCKREDLLASQPT